MQYLELAHSGGNVVATKLNYTNDTIDIPQYGSYDVIPNEISWTAAEPVFYGLEVEDTVVIRAYDWTGDPRDDYIHEDQDGTIFFRNR